MTQILNFGLPAPIDVQFEGSDIADTRKVADTVLAQLRQVPGLVDLRIQQPDDYPVLTVDVDRTKAAQGGYTLRDVGGSLQNLLSGSSQLTPHVLPQLQERRQLQHGGPGAAVRHPVAERPAECPAVLADQQAAGDSGGRRQHQPNHRDAGRQSLQHPPHAGYLRRGAGSRPRRGEQGDRQNRGGKREVAAARNLRSRPRTGRDDEESYLGLLAGLAFAIVLVYLLIVVNFQSWLDPFIIITALPAALAGIVLFLFTTRTTLSVPALMGAIMCMGVATANSILVVSFAKERLLDHGDAVMAAIEAGATRFRPVCMTALAMIIGMVPMALGAGEGGEQNAPLGRAVIGGLLLATVATLIFVPAVFAFCTAGASSSRLRQNPPIVT